MDMDIRVSVCLSDLRIVNLRQPVIGRYGTGIAQNQSPHGVGHCGVLLDSPVLHLHIAVYNLFVVQNGGLHIADFFSLFSVQDIGLRHIRVTCLNQNILHTVLNILNRNLSLYNFLLEI